MDIINEHLRKTRCATRLSEGIEFEGVRPWVICEDGFTVSIQASRYHYCTPQVNGAEMYETVELGFPNMEDSLIMDYAEEPERPTDTVYGYVPVHIVCSLIEKHGGIVNLKPV